MTADPTGGESNPAASGPVASPTMAGGFDGLTPGMHLVRAPLTANAVTTVALMRTLTRQAGWGGVYLSLDRPSRYVSFLLRKQGVDIQRITFVDVVTSISADRTGETDFAFVCEAFLKSKFLTGVFRRAMEGTDRTVSKVDLQAMDFLYVDNLATSLFYNPEERVFEFISDLKEIRAQRPGVKIVIFVQAESRAKFLTTLEAIADSNRSFTSPTSVGSGG